MCTQRCNLKSKNSENLLQMRSYYECKIKTVCCDKLILLIP